jgi:N-acetylglucosaminyldiphosphoundecaprenol N-acetyl-beta-D-mannosaminyltransferase
MFAPDQIVGTGAFHFTNVYTIVCASKDPKLANILRSEELISDGTPISLILRGFSKENLHIRGYDFMLKSLRDGNPRLRHYFLGSTEENLVSLSKNLKATLPNLNVVGMYAPPQFNNVDMEYQKWIEDIEKSHADMVWVGLGTPKQDFAVSLLAQHVNSNFIGVGAAFDFLSNSKSQAPSWIRGIGLEWAYRLIQEPTRLWRRYLFGNLYFLLRYFLPSSRLVLREIFRRLK